MHFLPYKFLKAIEIKDVNLNFLNYSMAFANVFLIIFKTFKNYCLENNRKKDLVMKETMHYLTMRDN